MRNPLPLFMLLGLAVLLAYAFFELSSGAGNPAGPAPSSPQSQQQECRNGAVRYCSIGNCSGTSLCVGGVWSGCRWTRTCQPGSRLSCLHEGCAYAVTECNECGTGYGPCMNST